MARANPSDAAQAHQVIAEAHEEAKAALAELRNLVRGLHPAVLEDRGLDAALSGVAARMPIPVRVTVDVPRRPSPTIEAIAYFVESRFAPAVPETVTGPPWLATVTVPQPVDSLTVQSYGAPVRVTTGSTSHVQVTGRCGTTIRTAARRR
jgi:hypothetical protein